MSLQFNIEARNEKNDLVWFHGLSIPKVSKKFISELDTILASLRFNNSNGILDSCSSTIEIQEDIPVPC